MATRTLECLDCRLEYEYDNGAVSRVEQTHRGLGDAASCPSCRELNHLVEMEETARRAEVWRKYEASQRRWTNVVYVLMALGVVWLFVVHPILRALD